MLRDYVSSICMGLADTTTVIPVRNDNNLLKANGARATISAYSCNDGKLYLPNYFETVTDNNYITS